MNSLVCDVRSAWTALIGIFTAGTAVGAFLVVLLMFVKEKLAAKRYAVSYEEILRKNQTA